MPLLYNMVKFQESIFDIFHQVYFKESIEAQNHIDSETINGNKKCYIAELK